MLIINAVGVLDIRAKASTSPAFASNSEEERPHVSAAVVFVLECEGFRHRQSQGVD
jgi:hypothetical protein